MMPGGWRIMLTAPIKRNKGFFLFDEFELKIHQSLRPLKNVQFCSRPRKVKILTAGIH
jgi:hypothetical protein